VRVLTECPGLDHQFSLTSIIVHDHNGEFLGETDYQVKREIAMAF